MRAAVAPATDVHAADLANGVDGALDSDEQRAELGREVGGHVSQVAVLARLEDHDHGQATRLLERGQEPALVAPDRVLVPLPATPAVGGILAEPSRLVPRRLERSHADVSLEREGLPVGDARHRHPPL